MTSAGAGDGSPAKKRGAFGLGLAVGIALFTGIIAWHGFGDVLAALRVAGGGLLVVAAFHLVPLVLDAFGWRALVPSSERPPAAEFVRGRWIGESVNSLLPVLQIGGIIVRAGMLRRRGVRSGPAGASVVVDMTLVALSLVAFSFLGVVILVGRIGAGRLGLVAALGAVLMAGMVGGFFLLQRRGLFGPGARILGRMTDRVRGASLGVRAEELDRSIGELYADRRALRRSFGWHLAAWLAGAGAVWLALRFLGIPANVPSALILESLVQAVRAAAFAVPGALGVQEGGYLVLGGALGIPPETCLALSLSKRARDLLLGLPGLVAWQAEVGMAGIGSFAGEEAP